MGKRKEKKLEERSEVETILGIGTKVEGIFSRQDLRVEGREIY